MCVLLVLLAFAVGCRKEERLDMDLEMAEDRAAREQDIQALRRLVERHLQTLDDEMDALVARTQETRSQDTLAQDARTQVGVAEAVAELRKQEAAIQKQLQHLADADALYSSQRRSIREALYELVFALETVQLRFITPRDAFEEAVQQRLDLLDQELEAMRRRAQNLAVELPAEYDTQFARLGQQHEALTRRFAGLKAASTPEFEQRRRAIIEPLATFRTEVHKVADSLALVGGNL